MDKTKLDWSWMQQHMPRVVAMIKRKRAEGRGDFVNECWRRGVTAQEPGWFYASEGGVSVGVPAEHLLADPVLLELRKQFNTAAVLMLRGEEVTDAQT